MKQLIGVLIMLLIIFTVAYFASSYLRTSTQELKDKLVTLKNHTISNNWEEAYNIDNEINKSWDNFSRIIPVLKDQGELHDLEITLSRISGLLDQKNRQDLLVEITIARKLLTAIYEQEKLTLKNIF